MTLDTDRKPREAIAEPVKLTTERGKTHGDWFQQSMLQNLVKADMHGAPRWHLLSASQKEALDMIAVKLSRIVCGNPSEPDHWDDIMGYALLGKSGGHPAIHAEEDANGEPRSSVVPGVKTSA
jgi:hypothetical protein